MLIDDIFAEELYQSRKTRMASIGVVCTEEEDGSLQSFLRSLPPIVWAPVWATSKVTAFIIPGMRHTAPSLIEWADQATIGTALLNVFSTFVWVHIAGIGLSLLAMILL
jgi:hypothetical protein